MWKIGWRPPRPASTVSSHRSPSISTIALDARAPGWAPGKWNVRLGSNCSRNRRLTKSSLARAEPSKGKSSTDPLASRTATLSSR